MISTFDEKINRPRHSPRPAKRRIPHTLGENLFLFFVAMMRNEALLLLSLKAAPLNNSLNEWSLYHD